MRCAQSNRPGIGALALLAWLLPAGTLAQAPVTDNSVDGRLNRLERTLSSTTLVQMLDTLQSLRKEVRQLRGEMEVQANEIRKLKKRQLEMYQDLDGRIQAGGSAPATAVAATEPAAGTQPATDPAPARPASTPVHSAVSAASADPAAEQAAYRGAFELLKSGKYGKAALAFSEFISTYPSGRFTDNAQYWLGESYYVTRKFDPALKAFEQLVANFPDSPKRGHALLKIGFIFDESGRKDEARKVLKELVAEDPGSTAAGLARKRLARLQQ